MLGVGSGINPVRLGSEVCKVEMCFVRSGGFALAITFVGSWELSVSCALQMDKRPCSGLRILPAVNFNFLVERII